MNQISSKPDKSAAENDYSRACIRIVSSMAPRLILEELTCRFSSETGLQVDLIAMGGVDAEQKLRESDAYDIAVLSKDAIEKLVSSGRLHNDFVDLLKSEVAIAIAKGAPHPNLNNELSLKEFVLSAKSISYSTGPSGRALGKLFEKWEISNIVNARLVCPPPGIPVGTLVANAKAELGFQQISELIHVEGVDVIGPLPGDIQIVTTFSAGICRNAKNLSEVKQLLDFMQSPATDDAKLRQGMRPA